MSDRLQDLSITALSVISIMTIALAVLFTVLSALTLDRYYFWLAMGTVALFYIIQTLMVFLGGFYGI